MTRRAAATTTTTTAAAAAAAPPSLIPTSLLFPQLLAADTEEMLQADVESEVRERKTLHRLAGGGGDGGEFGGPFDEEAVRLQVEERQAELRRVPGQEPQMVPVYTEASTPTDAAQLPRGEQSRQIAAKGVRMYAVILVDGKIVGTSGVTNLHPHDFCAPFDSAVQLQLLHAPTTMSVQLWSAASAAWPTVWSLNRSSPSPASRRRRCPTGRCTPSAPNGRSRRGPPTVGARDAAAEATSTPTCGGRRAAASGQSRSPSRMAQPATHERAQARGGGVGRRR